MHAANRMGSSRRRYRTWGARLLVAAAALAGGRASLSCTDLPDWNRDGCGNGVVNSGEDCDGDFPDGGSSADGRHHCGAVGSAQQCRYTCLDSDAADGGETGGALCPSGYACGVDKICRRPSGTFEALKESIPRARHTMLFADADGDGRADLFSQDGASTDVDYFNDSGHAVRTLQFQSSMLPAVGQLTSDALADFTFAGLEGGLVVMRGQGDQTFLPTTSPLYTSARDINAAFTVRQGADDLLVFISKDTTDPASEGQLVAVRPQKQDPKEAVKGYPVPLPVGAAAVRVAVGDIIPGTQEGCDEFVLWTGTSFVTYQPYGDADKCDSTDLRAVASLPAPFGLGAVRSLFLTRIDGDAFLDLVVVTEGTSTSQPVAVAVAHGDGAGAFGPALEPLCGAAGCDFEDLLAVADLDKNGAPDYLVATGERGNGMMIQPGAVILRYGSILDASTEQVLHPLLRDTQSSSTSKPAEATITDIDGDGNLDVLFTAREEANVFYFLNKGQQRFNPFSVVAAAPPGLFALGDFDGDSRADLAFTVLDTTNSTGSVDQILVAFGDANGTLAPAVSVGEVSKAKFLFSGAVIPARLPRTSTDLVAVSADTGASNITVFGASGNRQLLAPFIPDASASKGTDFTLPQPLRVLTSAVGDFITLSDDMTPHADVAVAVDEDGMMGGATGAGLHLFILGTRGEAVLSNSTADAVDIPVLADTHGYDLQNLQLVTIPGDPKGALDSLAVILPDSSGDGFSIVIYAPHGATLGTDAVRTHIANERIAPNTSICVADLGAPEDKALSKKDLAILTQPSSPTPDPRGGASPKQPAPAKAHVVVFWGGTAGIDLTTYEKVEIANLSACRTPDGAGTDPIPSDIETLSFACVEAQSKDNDTRELALVAHDAWYTARYADKAWACVSHGEISTPVDDPTSSRVDVYVGAGDVTGDGVDDLVISGAKNVTYVYRGVAETP